MSYIIQPYYTGRDKGPITMGCTCGASPAGSFRYADDHEKPVREQHEDGTWTWVSGCRIYSGAPIEFATSVEAWEYVFTTVQPNDQRAQDNYRVIWEGEGEEPLSQPADLGDQTLWFRGPEGQSLMVRAKLEGVAVGWVEAYDPAFDLCLVRSGDGHVSHEVASFDRTTQDKIRATARAVHAAQVWTSTDHTPEGEGRIG
jgi:hypothetical protein